VICDVVFAEIAPAFPSEADLQSRLHSLGVAFDPASPAAAFLAGQTFRAYRDGGGPRQHLVPDFLIAAHAHVQAGRLAALDRGYLRRYFPELLLLLPAE